MVGEQSNRKGHLRERLARGRADLLATVDMLSEAELARPVWSDGHGHWTARNSSAMSPTPRRGCCR